MNVTHRRLLVVDDNAANVEMLLDLLDDQGFSRVSGLTDSRQVLEHCRQQTPDLILLDIRMPHLDGYAVIEQLRQALGERAPAIIILTAQVDACTEQRTQAMGVSDFLTKPFEHADMLQRIHRVLET